MNPIFLLGLFIVVIWLLYKIIYCLFSGAALMWPLINIFAYLKVLLFPRSIRKIYGSSIAALSKNSFDQEITEYDKEEIEKLCSRKNELYPKLQSLENDLGALPELSKNVDGSISKRSNAGKQWYSITDNIKSVKGELSSLKSRGRSLEKKPYDAWNNWSKRYARYLGNRDSIIFMIVGFPVFFLTLLNINFIESYFPYEETRIKVTHESSKPIVENSSTESADFVTGSESSSNSNVNEVGMGIWEVDANQTNQNKKEFEAAEQAGENLMAIEAQSVPVKDSIENEGSYEVKFKNIMEIYMYVAFVGPVLSIYNDISLFQEGVFSSLISYDYAVHLKLNYDKVFTFINWVLVTLTMPILTLLCFCISWSIHKQKTIPIEPDDWKTNKFD
jgi:hypothetical protein